MLIFLFIALLIHLFSAASQLNFLFFSKIKEKKKRKKNQVSKWVKNLKKLMRVNFFSNRIDLLEYVS